MPKYIPGSVTVLTCSGVPTGIYATVETNGRTIIDKKTGIRYTSPSKYLRTVASSSHRMYYIRGEKYAGLTLAAAVQEVKLAQTQGDNTGLASTPREEGGIFAPVL